MAAIRLVTLLTSVLILIIGCPPSNSLSKYPLLIVVSFDGFRYDYFNKTDTPNLDYVAASGVKAPWIEARFTSITFPNHHSIATGLYEESHGIVSNHFYDPELNDTFEMSDTGAEWWDTGAVPVWVDNQEADPDRYSGGIMWPGTAAWIKNQTAYHYLDYNKQFPYKARVDVAIDWLTHPDTPANCIYLYFENPDSAGHQFGPDSPEVIAAIKEVDNITGYLVSKLQGINLYDKVNLIFTSDHGMTDIPPDNVIDMSKFIDISLFQSFGGSPVWSILPNDGQDDAVYSTLYNASLNSNFQVYWKEDIPEVYHYQHNDRIMPIVVVANDHYNIYPSYNDTADYSPGNHGYNNSLMDMHAFFIAHGPEFKTNYVSEPFRNIDIYPLACCLLGIEPSPNNGSLDSVRELLENPNLC